MGRGKSCGGKRAPTATLTTSLRIAISGLVFNLLSRRHAWGFSCCIDYIIAGGITVFSAANPGYGAENAQQQRMTDCNGRAIGMSGDARQKFMSSCLSNKPAEAKAPNCVNGKPCGNSCIAKDKVRRR